MKKYLILLTLTIMLLPWAQALGTDAMAVVSDTLPNGSIEVGKPFLLDIYLSNDYAELTGLSLPLSMYSSDASITSITHVDFTDSSGAGWNVFSADSVPFGTSYDDNSIVMYNGWQSLWGLLSLWYGTSWNGSLPDTINFSGATMSGWAISDTTKYLGFALQIDEEGTFCIDSVNHNNDAYDWLFDDPSTSFNGPYCWTVQMVNDVSEITDRNMLPTEYALGQNYPNPFNMQTKFEFALPKHSSVKVDVFNILGQKIKTVVDGEFEAGYYQADWDGTNQEGLVVASGMYFYKITADNFSSTKKLMLLK
jgi:hypothetical protein